MSLEEYWDDIHGKGEERHYPTTTVDFSEDAQGFWELQPRARRLPFGVLVRVWLGKAPLCLALKGGKLPFEYGNSADSPLVIRGLP